MYWFSILLPAAAVSLDGFLIGFSLGLRKINIPPGALTVLSLIPFALSYLAVLLGQLAQGFIPDVLGRFLGFSLLLLLAGTTFCELRQKRAGQTEFTSSTPAHILSDPASADKNDNQNIDILESLSLGFAVAIDNLSVAFTLGLSGGSPLIVALTIGIFHFILIGLGNRTAFFSPIRITLGRIYYLPVFLFVLLAVLRLF